MFRTLFIGLLLIIEISSTTGINGEKTSIIEALSPNVTVISGQKAVLTCTFSGQNDDLSLSSSHQLIWIRQSYASSNADAILAHNQDLLVSDPRLNIQRTDIDYSLTITDVNIDDDGIYACEVNTQPPQRAFVHLYVHEIPMIIDNATSSPIIVTEHENVTMKCQARGRPTPSIAWFRRGLESKETNKQDLLENQALANDTGGLFHLINVSRHQNGHYECRVSNGVNDHVVSKDIELRVLFPPAIRPQSIVIHSAIGKSTHLRCLATAPFDTSLYWRRIDNHSISSQSNRFRQQQHIHGDILHTTLYITDLEKNDFGSYGCFAESKAGRSKAVIELKEHHHPTATTTVQTSVIPQVLDQDQSTTTTTTTTTLRTQLLKRNQISEHTTSVIKSNLPTSSASLLLSRAPYLFISVLLLLFVY